MYSVMIVDSRKDTQEIPFKAESLGVIDSCRAFNETLDFIRSRARELLAKEYFCPIARSEEELDMLTPRTVFSGFRFVGYDGHVVTIYGRIGEE